MVTDAPDEGIGAEEDGMDSRSFDRLAVSMASGSSRRRVVAGLAAALGLGVAGVASAAKGGNGHGKGNGNGNGNSGNAPGHNKVGVCHRTGPKSNPSYRYLELPAGKAKGHEKHGDAINVDLATDVDNCGECGTVCEPTDACSVATCADGACGETPVECAAVECQVGTCNPTNPATGLCDYTNVADDTPCAGGTCQAGECVVA